MRTPDDPIARTASEGETLGLADEPEFRIGQLRFQPATRQLLLNGDSETLEPKVMQLLTVLARRRGEVVSRDALVEHCWEGRAVSDDAINRPIAKVRRLGEVHGDFQLETIPRVGYRLVERGSAESPTVHRRWFFAAAAALLLVAAAATYWLVIRETRPAAAEPVSLAVLPFRNLAAGDDYFAEGVAEEILTQLARQPGLRVAGRTSSWTFRDNPDIREVGRRLDVAYVLEGSVRRAGDRVRVDVALVDTSNGMRLWSQGFGGDLDDIFAIQSSIGSAVAGNLRREIVLAQSPSGPLTTRGDVYALYLTARGLLRSRMPSRVDAAVDLLRRVVEEDPNYAPAWSSLGIGVGLQAVASADLRTIPQKRAEALSCARRALELAPQSSEAHSAYGALLFQDSLGAAKQHLERAVALDANNAEAWHYLSVLYDRLGTPQQALNAARRAVRIDPLWWRAIWVSSDVAWDQGHRDEALSYLRRSGDSELGRSFGLHWARARLADLQGDYSGELAEAQAAIRVADGSNIALGQMAATNVYMRLGYPREARAIRPDLVSDNELMLRQGTLPADVLANTFADDRRRTPVSLHRYLGLRVLANQGRRADIAAFYDRTFGSPDALARHPEGHLAFVLDGAVISQVLMDSGRGDEARRILSAAGQQIQARLARGNVPHSYLGAYAQVWAVAGRNEAALSALERAVQSGWFYAGHLSLGDIGSEPAFRGLHGIPRFDQLRRRLNDHIARERRELAPGLV